MLPGCICWRPEVLYTVVLKRDYWTSGLWHNGWDGVDTVCEPDFTVKRRQNQRDKSLLQDIFQEDCHCPESKSRCLVVSRQGPVLPFGTCSWILVTVVWRWVQQNSSTATPYYSIMSGCKSNSDSIVLNCVNILFGFSGDGQVSLSQLSHLWK